MDKRESILYTALRLFVENGFQATPTSRIAKEAGVATGTLFHYFKTKEELINELYLDSKEKMFLAIREGQKPDNSIKSRFKLLFANTSHWASNHPNEYLFFQMYSNSSFIKEETKALGSEKFGFLIEMVIEGQKAEILKNISPEVLMGMLFGAMMGAMQFCISDSEYSSEEFQEIGFRMIWDMIKE